MAKPDTILLLDRDDEEREIEFELDYLLRLSFDERLAMMRSKSAEMLRQLVEHGHRKPFEIVQRPLR